MIQAECKMQLTYLLGMQSWNYQYLIKLHVNLEKDVFVTIV